MVQRRYIFGIEYLRSRSLQKAYFLSSPIASKHSTFPHTKASASEVPAILMKFVLKEATLEAAILKLSWQPGHVYVMSFSLAQNWWEGEKPAND